MPGRYTASVELAVEVAAGHDLARLGAQLFLADGRAQPVLGQVSGADHSRRTRSRSRTSGHPLFFVKFRVQRSGKLSASQRAAASTRGLERLSCMPPAPE